MLVHKEQTPQCERHTPAGFTFFYTKSLYSQKKNILLVPSQFHITEHLFCRLWNLEIKVWRNPLKVEIRELNFRINKKSIDLNPNSTNYDNVDMDTMEENTINNQSENNDLPLNRFSF